MEKILFVDNDGWLDSLDRLDSGTFAASGLIETNTSMIEISESEREMHRRLERRQREVDDLLKSVLES